MKNKVKKYILVLGDLFFLYLSLFIVLLLRYGKALDSQRINKHVIPFTFIYLIWIVVFYIWDLYNLSRPLNYKHFINALIMNGIIAIIIFYTIPYLHITPKTNLVLNVLIFISLFIIWRKVFNKIFHLINYTDQIAIIGINEHSLELLRTENENKGYYISVIFTMEKSTFPKWVYDLKKDIRKNLNELNDVIEQKSIKKFVVSDRIYAKTIKQFYPYISKGISFYPLPVFWEEYYQRIPIYATNEMWFLENLRDVEKMFYEKVKRIADVAMCMIMLPIYFILYPLIAITIKINSHGQVLYKQTRAGKQGKVFTIKKFRTMLKDAEKEGVQWAAEDDPRITEIGRILRATRLDELPQLLSIFRGDLSFIGPRPERPEFVKTLVKKIPHYNLRHLVKPGMTGWAQINYPYGSSEQDAAKKLEYDLYYIKNRSIIFDLKIALRTIMIVLSGKGR